MSKVLVVALAAVAYSAFLKAQQPAQPLNSTSVMNLQPTKFMEVEAGPFPSTEEACNSCGGSFTKEGSEEGFPVEPVAPSCVCYAHPADGGFDYFCSTTPAAAEYVQEKEGCTCKPRDMEAMGKTTCTPL